MRDPGTLDALDVRLMTGPAPALARFTYPRLAGRLNAPLPSSLAVGAFWGGRPVGLALGSSDEMDARLVSIMVDRTVRRRGIAASLLRVFVSAAAKRGSRRVETRYPGHLSSRNAVDQMLQGAGWAEPRLLEVQLTGLAGAMSETVGEWPGVRRLIERPGAYRIEPWACRTGDDDARIKALLAEPNRGASSDPRTWKATSDPDLSLAVRRNGILIGWVIAERLFDGCEGRTSGAEVASVNYPSAYCARAHQRSGILIAAYHSAFSRQATLLGPQSRAIYQTHPAMKAMLALTMRRFAPIALRVDEIIESHLVLQTPADDDGQEWGCP